MKRIPFVMKKTTLTRQLILALPSEGYIVYEVVKENAISIPDLYGIHSD